MGESQQRERSPSGSGDIVRQRKSTIPVENERKDGTKVELVDGADCSTCGTIKTVVLNYSEITKFTITRRYWRSMAHSVNWPTHGFRDAVMHE